MSEITTEVESYAKEQLAVADRVGGIVVRDQKSADGANDLLQLLRGASKMLEAKRVELTAPLLMSKRRIDEFFNSQTDKLDVAARELKSKISEYVEQERARAEAEAAKVRAAQEAERKRLEDEARKAEQAAAAARAKAQQEAEEARRKAEVAAAEGRQAEAAKQAEIARGKLEAGEQAAGKLETAAAVKRETAVAVPVAAPEKVTAPKGFSTRKVYGVEVRNMKALVEAVAAGKHPMNFLQPNETALRQFAQAAKEGFEVAGCELTTRNV